MELVITLLPHIPHGSILLLDVSPSVPLIINLFASVIYVVTEDARNAVLHEILYADDLVLTSKSSTDFKDILF